jgi:hypothetical protein
VAVAGTRGYLRLLAGIVLSYGLMIVLTNPKIGGPARIALVGYLLWVAWHMRRARPASRGLIWVLAGTAVAFAAAVWASVAREDRLASGLVGGLTFATIGVVIGLIIADIVSRGRVDTPTVLAVLCIYLLLALIFASLNQLLAAFDEPYLSGTLAMPTSSDQLYFSVITIATVGFGDVTPASSIARAVTVVEALTGQLYLVSVVAAVVGGWRREGTPAK